MTDVIHTDLRAKMGTYHVSSRRGAIWIDLDGPPKRALITVRECDRPDLRRAVWDYDMPIVWSLLRSEQKV